jgi:phage FluMu protein Com
MMGGEHSLTCPSCNFVLAVMVDPHDLLLKELKCPCCKVTSWLPSYKEGE